MLRPIYAQFNVLNSFCLNLQNWPSPPAANSNNANSFNINSGSANEANTDNIEGRRSRELSTTINLEASNEKSIPNTTAIGHENSNNQSVNYLRNILTSSPVRQMIIDQCASPDPSPAPPPSPDRSSSPVETTSTRRRLLLPSTVTSNLNDISTHDQSPTPQTSQQRRSPFNSNNSMQSQASSTSLRLGKSRQRSSSDQRGTRTESPDSGREESTNNNNKKKPRRVATQRLEKTIEATDKLIHVIEKKTELKRTYYEHKLEIMSANTSAQSRIASALASIASTINRNSE